MKPTAQLRFVERQTMQFDDFGSPTGYVTKRILQQWWEISFENDNTGGITTFGEWRDVPVEEEK